MAYNLAAFYLRDIDIKRVELPPTVAQLLIYHVHVQERRTSV